VLTPRVVHSSPLASASAIPPLPPPTGIEFAENLAPFFRRLRSLDPQRAGTATPSTATPATDDVRILQFGDSHTASDTETVHLRRKLSARFGDGGRGFVALGQPFKGYLQEGIAPQPNVHLDPERGHLDHGVFTGDGRYGLLGISLEGKKKGAIAATRVDAPTSRFAVGYLEQPKGGSFDVYIDGVKQVHVRTASDDTRVGYTASTVVEGAHSVEARLLGDGPVRLLGLELDRDAVGVSVEALGINGARAQVVDRWDEAVFADALARRRPALLVLSYGTNESADEQPVEKHMLALANALGKIRRAVPEAACLLHGPPDRAILVERMINGELVKVWETAPRVIEIIEAERALAKAAGCGFWDALGAIGGPGTMAAWAAAEKPLGREDHVHYTFEGYRVLGEKYGDDLLAAYDRWKVREALPNPPALPR
jgi:lysophospholipase L1-like esterase